MDHETQTAGTEDTGGRSRRGRLLLLRVAIAVILLTGIFTLRASLRTTAAVMWSADKVFLVFAACSVVLGELLSVWKWQILLRSVGHRPPFLLLVRSSLIGMFYNNLLPGSVGGDVVRSLMAAPYAGGRACAAASVFMQRNTGLAALLMIANAAAWWYPVRLRLFPPSFTTLNSVRFWFGALALAYIGVNLLLMNRTLSGLVCQAAGHFSKPLAMKLSRLHDAYLSFRRPAVPAVAVSLITQMTDCVTFYLIARAVGMSLPLPFVCVLETAVNVAALLPLSVNGIGLREATSLVLLESVGRGADAAVAISLVYLGYVLCLALVGGWLHWHGSSSKTQVE